MVIGAQQGNAPGIPKGIEDHELLSSLRPYIGEQFPLPEIFRLPAGEDPTREVLVVVALPPEPGQTIFPCHKAFQPSDKQDTKHSLANGAIYVRTSTETRVAHAGEIQTLVLRAQAGGQPERPPIDLEIGIGSINRPLSVQHGLSFAYGREETKFVEAAEQRADQRRNDPMSTILASVPFPGQVTKSDAEMLAEWREQRATNMRHGRELLLGSLLPGVTISVTSRARLVSKPELTLRLHECEAVPSVDLQSLSFAEIVPPVMQRSSLYQAMDMSYFPNGEDEADLDWRNDGSDVVITVTPASFRPNTAYLCGESLTVFVRDIEAGQVRVSWRLTEDDSDVELSDELQIQTEEVFNVGRAFLKTFYNV